MTDLPILYSGPMVRALLAGTKTQTRRWFAAGDTWDDEVKRTIVDGLVWPIGTHGQQCGAAMKLPRYSVGDRLWVREAWRTFVSLDAVPPREILKPGRGAGILYEADNGGLAVTAAGERTMGERDDARAFGKLRPSMFMPRWASRLTQVVTDVRVQRLQEINEEDAIAEGLIRKPFASALAAEMGCDWGFEGDRRHGSPVSAYAALWDSINGPGSWDANPWIVAYTVETHLCNIDETPAGEGGW